MAHRSGPAPSPAQLEAGASSPPHLPTDNEIPWDLYNTTPLAFTQILKATFTEGKDRAAKKFQVLRALVTLSLPSAPPPGPATFTVQCLESLLTMEPPYNEGLSHLLTSALNHIDAGFKSAEDLKQSRRLAAVMFKNAITGVINLDARILVRLLVVFGIQLKDVGEAASAFNTDEDGRIEEAKAIVAPFILSLVKERSYTSAVALLKQFDLQDFAPRDFLATMVTDGEPDLAGQWAAHMGMDMCCCLVQQCTEMGLYKVAYRLVQRYNLENHFPDAYLLYKQSSLRKLATRGLWDVAESIAVTDPVLQEYLVVLALEEGDATQAAELCDRFHMEQFPTCNVVADVSVDNNQYLKLSDVMPSEKVFWVDSADSLAFAAKQFRHATAIGFDSEWKANHVKGSQENKVSILQLSTPEFVFIYDMLRLIQEEPEALNDCLKLVFHSPTVLKLGYAINNDLERLSHSYPGLECFAACESLLDLQNFAGRTKGGLSHLAKLAVGGFLDKRVRMSDWEKRPLNEKQLQYAALDAAVLIPIFKYLQSAPASEGNSTSRDFRPFLMSSRIPHKKWKQLHPTAFVLSSEGLQQEQAGRGNMDNAVEVDASDTDGSNQWTAKELQAIRRGPDLMVEEEEIERCELENGDYLGASAAINHKFTESRSELVHLQSEVCKQNMEPLHTSIDDVQCGGIVSETARNQAQLPQKSPSVRSSYDKDTQLSTEFGSTDLSGPGTDNIPSINDPKMPIYHDSDFGTSSIEYSGSEESAGLISPYGSNVDNEIATAINDLVSATYELVGQPIPGLLKSKLQEFTQAAGLPLPLYQAEAQGPDHMPSFRCAVEVAGERFWGNIAYKKKDAELMAAQTALAFFQAELQMHRSKHAEGNEPLWMRNLRTSSWNRHWGHLHATSMCPTIINSRGASGDFPTEIVPGYHWSPHAEFLNSRSLWLGHLNPSSSFVRTSLIKRHVAFKARQHRSRPYFGPSVVWRRLTHVLFLS